MQAHLCCLHQKFSLVVFSNIFSQVHSTYSEVGCSPTIFFQQHRTKLTLDLSCLVLFSPLHHRDEYFPFHLNHQIFSGQNWTFLNIFGAPEVSLFSCGLSGCPGINKLLTFLQINPRNLSIIDVCKSAN